MPISPQQIIQDQLKAELNVRIQIMDIIDRTLREKFDGSGTVTVSVPKDLKLSRSSFKVITEDYREAGWMLTMREDQRDGSWFELRPLSGIQKD